MSKTKLKKITKANITHVSFVPKGANGQDFLIVKEEGITPNLQVESPIIKTDDDKRLVTGVVYAPGVVDSQGEFMEAEAIEEAAHEFLAKHRNTDVRHNFIANEGVEIVESAVAKADYELDGVPIKKGTWTITAKVGDDKLWQGIKKGEYNGFSMGGTGIREEVIIDNESVKKENTEPVAEEAMGFFAAMKNFFAGGEKPVVKADNAKESMIVDFKGIDVSNKISNYNWELSDAIRKILQSAETNKRSLVAQQIDNYRDFVLSEIDESGIKKAAELFNEPIEKAGRSISSANAAKIKAAHEALSELMSMTEETKEEDQMKKEDVTAIVKEAIDPIVAKLDALEKGEKMTETPAAEGITKEDIGAIIKEALAPIEERISTVEKSRGVSRQLESEREAIVKEDQPFYGVQI